MAEINFKDIRDFIDNSKPLFKEEIERLSEDERHSYAIKALNQLSKLSKNQKRQVLKYALKFVKVS